jgi:hypothetical protein
MSETEHEIQFHLPTPTDPERNSCVVCADKAAIDVCLYPVCTVCARKYPPFLIKANCDPFDYALRLRTGECIRFVECKIFGDWVLLEQIEMSASVNTSPAGLPYPCPRGVWARVDDIVWMADAPEGS